MGAAFLKGDAAPTRLHSQGRLLSQFGTNFMTNQR